MPHQNKIVISELMHPTHPDKILQDTVCYRLVFWNSVQVHDYSKIKINMAKENKNGLKKIPFTGHL